jgi:hypothetical protein
VRTENKTESNSMIKLASWLLYKIT